MKTRALFGCLVLLMILSVWTVGRADSPGERLYGSNCQRCHGPEGRGGRGPKLVPFQWSDEEALALVRRPLCDMPPFPESDLSDADVAQIVSYLKSLK